MARRNILFILPALSAGGAERVTLSLLRALDRGRWNPTLMLVKSEPGALEADLPVDVPVLRIGATKARQAWLAILRTIWLRRPHIVFVTLDHMNILVGWLRPLMPPGTRLVLRVTDFGSLQFPGFRRMMGVALRLSDLTIYQSVAMKETFRRVMRLGASHRGLVIRNAIAIERVREAAASSCAIRMGAPNSAGWVTLVAAGRLVEAKGFDLLIDALGMLSDTRVRLFILGEGPLAPQLASLIAGNGLNGQVQLCGFQENPHAWFAEADIFVLSSRSEGFPNVVLEALACGIPVIATPLPGLEEVPGVTLTEDVSAEAIARRLAEWIKTRPSLPEARVSVWLAKHDSTMVARRYDEAMLALCQGTSLCPREIA